MPVTLVTKLVKASIDHRWTVIILSALLSITAGYYTATHFAITTDTGKLIDSSVRWRQLEIGFDKAFPQRSGLTVIVIDAKTPEQAEQAARALDVRLKTLPSVIQTVDRPDGGEFFNRNGLLFLSKADVTKTVNQLLAAQPFLGSLAADPSLRGLMSTLSLMALGVSEKETTFDAILAPMKKIADGLEAAGAGKTTPFSWRELLTGQPSKPKDLRRLVLVRPILDFSALEPGQAASEAIRSAARDLGLTPENGVTIRLTGNVPLADEEFATVADGAALNSTVTVLVVIFILWMALRSFKIIGAVFISLMVGFALTAAIGLMLVSALNLISVAFAVLFVGLGVDFGLQYSVRYREERHIHADTRTAILGAADKSGSPLALAAASVAAGFYAFLPTEYRGLSELGLIAGTGMIIAFLTSITLLPALLSLFRTPDEPQSMGYKFLAPVDHFLARHRKAVLVATAILSIGGLPLLAKVRFDFNPINLRSVEVESVSTYLDLERDPTTSPNTIDIVSPSLNEAARVAETIGKLPEVEQVVTLASFIPDDQDEKLEQIQDMAVLLEPTLTPPEIKPAPSDGEVIEAMKKASTALAAAAKTSEGRGADEAQRLADILAALAAAPQAARQRAAAVMLPGLQLVLDQTRDLMKAEPVTFDTLPADLKDDWLTKDGKARVEIFAKGDSNNNDVLKRFVDAVRTVSNDITGPPVSIQESGKTIVHAFIQAGIWALISIMILLYIVLRRVGDVLLTLVPLILAGVVTLEICALIDLPLNFANIIALPLLLGVGVAFKVYFVMAWRAGETELLQSSLTRAVFFSAMTTATAFGSLWLSKHPGTSSMGKLLALSLVCTLAAAVLFQPALMGPPRDKAKDEPANAS
ncbi:MAG: MMPL family transporter [Beijerinckiaceae bacterium]|nr:MMPL family transporter [Beijerinckiaceae bacterium]